MPASANLPKYEQLRRSLLERIHSGEFPVGARFPTIGETSQAMGVSCVTAHRAYRLLAEEGFLSSRAGRHGTRVISADKQPAKVRKVVVTGVFRSFNQRNPMENYALDMFEGVCRTLSSHQAGMIHHRTDSKTAEAAWPALDKALKDLDEGFAQGVVLDQLVTDDALRKVEASEYPAVLLNRHPDGIGIDSVAPDVEWAGRETAKRALLAGYRHIVLCEARLRGQVGDPVRLIRSRFYDDYIKGVSESGFFDGSIEKASLPPLAEHVEFQADDEAFCSTLGVPERPGGERTLFVNTNDSTALRLLRILHERGFQIPRDAGVVGLVDADCNRRAKRPVTTWRIDSFKMGMAAGDMLLDRIEFPGRPPARRYIKPVFVDHGTL